MKLIHSNFDQFYESEKLSKENNHQVTNQATGQTLKIEHINIEHRI